MSQLEGSIRHKNFSRTSGNEARTYVGGLHPFGLNLKNIQKWRIKLINGFMGFCIS